MIPKVRSFAAFTVFNAVSLLAGTGCDDVDWPEPQYVDSLRVLGVRAESPTLTPGGATELSVLCVDGRHGSKTEPTCDVEVAWFAHCDNPEENDPDNCIGDYSKWSDELSARVASTPKENYPDGFGFGPTFDFKAPNDILRQDFTLAGKAAKYGVSYVFFAVCAGQLVSVPNPSRRLPLECRDRETGKTLDQRSFVVGVTTLYSYDAFTNRNPVLLTPRFDEADIPDRCGGAALCPDGFECSIAERCIPVVQHCAKADPQDCKEHCLSFEVGLDSFRLFSAEGSQLENDVKSLWLSYLTNAGNLPADETNFALTAPSDPERRHRTPCIRWQAPTEPTEDAHLWAVVRDNRGGLTAWDQRVIVR